MRYLASVLFFPAAVGWLAINHVTRPHPHFLKPTQALSQLVPKHRWDWTKTASCIGQVLQAGLQISSESQ